MNDEIAYIYINKLGECKVLGQNDSQKIDSMYPEHKHIASLHAVTYLKQILADSRNARLVAELSAKDKDPTC
jgi:hypothetical protein